MRATDTGSSSQDCCVARGQRRPGQCLRLALGDLKTILVQRQALLKRLDPTGALSVPTLRTQLQPLVRQYERLVILDRADADTDLRDAQKIYNYFHQLNHAPDWGEIPLSCTCRFCFGNCVCKHTLLSCRCSSRKYACLIPGSLLPHLSVKSASPSRELPGAGDFASLRSASATKRASTQSVP